MDSLSDMTARKIAAMVTSGSTSAREVVDHFLDRIKSVDHQVKAFLEVFEESSRSRADEIDEKRSRGKPLGRLAGVPVAVKDNICTSHRPTTAGSKILEGYCPPYSATAVERIEEEDGIVIGKTNLDEFAMGSSGENSAFFATANPWDLSLSPGGSSSGSAAAVAARMIPLALGSDTGGSVRLPAALTGIVAIKPTYGRVSRYGLVAFASSLDQIGPMAANLDDTALLLKVIGGRDDRDGTSFISPPQTLPGKSHRWRIGVVREMSRWNLAPSVQQGLEEALDHWRDRDVEIVEISLPHLEYELSTYQLLSTAEASSNLARYDGIRYPSTHRGKNGLVSSHRSQGFGREVQRRILLGTFVLSAGHYEEYYQRAQNVRSLICRDYGQVFETVDAVVGPTSLVPPFPLGEKVDRPLDMYELDRPTVGPSLAGLPAISLPIGFTEDGLPRAVQLTGPAGSESRLLHLAEMIEGPSPANQRPLLLE